MKRVLCVLAFISIGLSAECRAIQNEGVEWVEGISWEQVLQKAKAENKYVFVDCFTTWCGPCKAMEKNVYPDQRVGDAVNGKFIAVKVQMDQTTKDDENIKGWYRDAKKIEEDYKVAAYPTLLFFSPEGKLLHKSSQGYNVEGFLDLLSIALDPQKQYYTLLSEYQSGNRDQEAMKQLAKATKNFGDKKLALQIAEDYLSTLKSADLYSKEIREFCLEFHDMQQAKALASKYIKKLNSKEVYTLDNLNFIRQFTESTSDKGFKLFYENSDRINRIMARIKIPAGALMPFDKGDYAQSLVRQVISNEEIHKKIFKPLLTTNPSDVKPDWLTLFKNLKAKYPKADIGRIILEAQTKWYAKTKNWQQYSTYAIIQMDRIYKGKNLAGKMFDINNACWPIFQRATDKNILNRAIYWMEEAFRQNPKDSTWATAIDTYANLLYKVGRKQEALRWQEKAVKLDSNDGLKEAFKKMQKGEPTWPQDKGTLSTWTWPVDTLAVKAKIDFSGRWKLILDRSEYGEAPINTLIKEVVVTQNSTEIIILRIAGDSGKEVSSTESPSFDGKVNEQVKSSYTKKANLKWSDDGKQFKELASYDYKDDNMDRNMIETWSIDEGSKNLVIVRDVVLKSGPTYSTKCVYEKVK